MKKIGSKNTFSNGNAVYHPLVEVCDYDSTDGNPVLAINAGGEKLIISPQTLKEIIDWYNEAIN